MRNSRILLLALVCGATPLASYCGVEVGISLGGPEVVVSAQPPPGRVEVVPAAPGPGYIWIRGHWSWHHERWVWVDGRWDLVRQPGLVWVPGQWVSRGNGWVWMEGHYTNATVAPAPAPGQAMEVVASEEPPTEIVETIPVSPGPEYFWIGGHWHWNGGWVWLSGHYERHPHFHPGARWEPGHWAHRGDRWVWHDGHWR